MSQCAAITTKGTQCLRAAAFNDLCAQHARIAGKSVPKKFKSAHAPYNGPSVCAGRTVEECNPPACGWKLASATKKAHCASKKHTQRLY